MITTDTGQRLDELDELTARLPGRVHTRDDPGFATAAAAWNLNARHDPIAVVEATGASDVQQAVRWARRHDVGVGVIATGHGTGTPCQGGLLIRTSAMRGVEIDPVARTARVAAGVLWHEVITAAADHGLAVLAGSSPQVGVVGYTLGGGFGWLARRHGLAAHAIIRAELITADGELLDVDAEHHPERFWALAGGTGNFGIVTALEFRLLTIDEVYAGNLYYPLERAADVLAYFAEWARDAPLELTAATSFLRFPPRPELPEPLRGQSLVALRGCWCGPMAAGHELVGRARAALGPAALDTFAPIPPTQLGSLSMDPPGPLGARNHTDVLPDLDHSTIAALVELFGPNSGSPLVMAEVRTIGGAMIGPAEALSPIAHTTARYSLNAIGITPDPTQAAAVAQHLDRVRRRLAPMTSGETYLNFLDLDGASPERIRAAFTEADRRRLLELKRAVDPDDIFRFNRNIPDDPRSDQKESRS